MVDGRKDTLFFHWEKSKKSLTEMAAVPQVPCVKFRFTSNKFTVFTDAKILEKKLTSAAGSVGNLSANISKINPCFCNRMFLPFVYSDCHSKRRFVKLFLFPFSLSTHDPQHVCKSLRVFTSAYMINFKRSSDRKYTCLSFEISAKKNNDKN